jgi:type IV pilus assembly protein PilA
MFCHTRKFAGRREAFTLVEIMVVVVIIGLLAALAIPAFQRVKSSSIASRYANDFRTFSEAFQRYSFENGSWPAASATPGAIPVGMTGYLPARYSETSPMGGGYTWAVGPARIRLVSTQATDDVMQKVDAILDDGDLQAGQFSKMSSGGFHYVIE